MKTIKLEDKIIYQIFPRSFYDSNNDGNGDLKGITLKLPYLKKLGINAIWLCPIYKTDFVDAGYDVLDYKSVWKQFGSLKDFKELATQARKLGIDIIMDIVLNHVSNNHKWFKKACLSTQNLEHDYFIWREKLTSEEQKATSIFGGSAWEYVPSVKKYYFHLFSKEQVDLNWSHPNTIKAMVDVINFWYKLGVRGFRLDAIKHVSKTFENVDQNPYFAWNVGAVEYLKTFNKLAFSDKPDAYTLGEASGITADEILNYGAGQNQVSQNFYNFSWWWIGWGKQTGRNGFDANWDYKNFIIQQQPFQHNQQIKPHMFTNFLSNHDTSRSVSRWGDENIFREESAKTHALMLFVLKGIPCIYYGEEIGLLNTHFEKRSQFRDVDIFNGFASLVDKEKIYSEDEFFKYMNINSRDAGRSLMQWDSSTNAGFNLSKTPWLKTGRRSSKINVEKALKDRDSIFYFYQKLIKIRKKEFHDVLIYGTSECQVLDNGLVMIKRSYKNEAIIAYLNLTSKEIKAQFHNNFQLLSSYKDKKIVKSVFRPFESILIKKQL
ncbi:alpha-amylase family glycosyl hydrolase [Mesomycoplasma hyorhinis]|uniref:Alpha-amylase n=2 Tax=Mesomycoplasma hyorhinis TaxID=2100 RepID=A0AAI8AMJ9_MESHY|nr:alpha-amylase family glycosyl hydrolase [Mesomycoplasma hyorhinis]AEC45772.1 Sucrase-isomaltase [Mesomycoplasma hyorhinis MCLD]AEX13984.1 Sucrase-isomaltase (Oligo-1,6-glucosidase) [Mesomycoplasma hyorhinis GDL-1]AFX74142.1 Trehalose-6-phosphate hydrolase [Mesomycoplasma hyorhinis SK76]AHA40961.1 Sucrase-isomaltase (Oligo-1,6-glucosidase) [Mesomycoplasma hyorhinis DBS 1050]AOD25197.1 Sucrase-isomaltase (Oligo-1,6-glucosidase) [Mesomycoplasma hyorhinis]